MTLKTVFFCGDKSPYGFAHIKSICHHFDVRAIILADEQRWAHFRRTLNGGDEFSYKTTASAARENARSLLRKLWLIYRKIKHSQYLKSQNIPVYVVNDANSNETLELVKSISPDVLLSAAYPQIFSGDLINIPSLGAVNFHPSLLPRFRGAHPHYWSLALGEETGGVTAHFMTPKIDNGDIIAQRSFKIDNLYYAEHYQLIIDETPLLVRDTSKFLVNPENQARPQDESKACYFRNDREIHRRLDFTRMNAQELRNLIRAGGAYTTFKGRKTVISQAEIAPNNRHITNGITVPAAVIVDISNEGVWISTSDVKFLQVKQVVLSGKHTDFKKWVARESIKIGENLG